MNARVHPLFALLVIVLTLAAIGVWMWGDANAKRLGGPADLLLDPSGHLYVQMQQYLLEHDSDGEFVARHDLSKLGIERVLGGMAFFPNGDLLLRRGSDARSLLDNVRAYLRLPNRRPVHSDAPNTGLHRCSLETGECRQFGPGAIDFNAAFSVFIDAATQEVYLSDTSRHRLQKYSSDGNLLAEGGTGLRFPNELQLIDSRLYFANTNRHSIDVVDPDTENFAAPVVSKDVVPQTAQRSRQIWPSHFARIGDEWWVNNMRSNMADGGVYIFDRNWQFERRVNLPDGADPITILEFGDDVLVSDWNNDAVYRVGPDGRLLGRFQSSGLQALVDESIERRWQYQTWGYMGIIALALLIIALLVKGLLAGPQDAVRDEVVAKPPQTEYPDEPVWIAPDEKMARKVRISTWLGAAFFILPLPLLGILIIASGAAAEFLQFMPPLFFLGIIFLALLRVNNRLVGSAIRLEGDRITLRDHTGRERTFPIRDVIYNETTIAGPDAAVFLGQRQMAVYDKEVLATQLFPRLAEARSVPAWEMQKALFRMRHPQTLTLIIVFLGVLAGAAWLLLQGAA